MVWFAPAAETERASALWLAALSLRALWALDEGRRMKSAWGTEAFCKFRIHGKPAFHGAGETVQCV